MVAIAPSMEKTEKIETDFKRWGTTLDRDVELVDE